MSSLRHLDKPNYQQKAFLKFTKSIGAEVDKSAKGLGIRSNRYTMLIENGIVKKFELEKETATCELSAAENFLNTI